MEKNKTSEKHLYTLEMFVLLLTFNPGLTLTGLCIALPCLQQVNLTWAHDPTENQHLVSSQLHKNTWPWWAPTLSLQYGHMLLVSRYFVLTGVNWPYYRCPISKKEAIHCKSVCQPFSWSMAIILCDAIIITIIIHMCPWTILLATITSRKSIHGFPFLSYNYGYGTLLGGSLDHQSSTIIRAMHLWHAPFKQ